MSKLIKLSTLVLLLASALVSSCTKTENHYYTVENVTVSLNSKELLETVVKPFKASTRMSATSSTTEYEHQFPSSYTAYFISKETKGEYTTGQLVKTINVVAGNNNITIPKLNYDIYITNYEHSAEKWYTWNKAIEQLPQSSTELYLYGKNSIDYSKVTEGTVELTNPYAAVMIKKNQWINGVPTHNVGNKEYALVGNGSWYLLYIRNNNTNTKVPVKINGYSSDNYQLNKAIEPNNIYQYTIDGSVPDLNDGNLGVIVKPFEKIIKETIKL